MSWALEPQGDLSCPVQVLGINWVPWEEKHMFLTDGPPCLPLKEMLSFIIYLSLYYWAVLRDGISVAGATVP